MLVQCGKIFKCGKRSRRCCEISIRTGHLQISYFMQILAIFEHETEPSCTCLAQNLHTKKTCLDSLGRDFPHVIYLKQYFMQNSFLRRQNCENIFYTLPIFLNSCHFSNDKIFKCGKPSREISVPDFAIYAKF